MRRLTPWAVARPSRRHTRGMSLVELMVGVAVGLLVVAAASFVAVNQLGDTRRLLLETQVQQDLRAAADLISRDLRRAGYWDAAEAGVWNDANPNVAANPYAAINTAAHEVNFEYARDTANFGFKLQNGSIRMRVGDAWQELTDATVLKVTQFDVAVNDEAVVQSCFKECAGGGTACWPKQDVRRVTIDIAGEAVADAVVKRSLSTVVRLRNDATSGACPA
jgi:prepilin-type N-terminal cleavage/methylation domain-containing protein